MDSGATDHICCSLHWFDDYHQINSITLKMPNGNVASASLAKDVKFSDEFTLRNVLYLLEFNLNLVSI